jgi:hypothetical protein
MITAEDTPDEPTSPSNLDEVGRPDEGGRRWWPFVLAALAVLVGVSLLVPAGRHQWAISLIRQPTPYTALSFRDAAGLPHDIDAGARVHLSFTVANHEGRSMKYAYVLSSTNLVGDHASKTLLRATLTVPDGGQGTESVTVRPGCASSSCQLQVSLPGRPEAIDVILNVHRPGG